MLLMSLNNCKAIPCYCSGKQQWRHVACGFVLLVIDRVCSSANQNLDDIYPTPKMCSCNLRPSNHFNLIKIPICLSEWFE